MWGQIVTAAVAEQRETWRPPAAPAGDTQQQESALRAAFGLRGGKANG